MKGQQCEITRLCNDTCHRQGRGPNIAPKLSCYVSVIASSVPRLLIKYQCFQNFVPMSSLALSIGWNRFWSRAEWLYEHLLRPSITASVPKATRSLPLSSLLLVLSVWPMESITSLHPVFCVYGMLQGMNVEHISHTSGNGQRMRNPYANAISDH